MPTIITAERPDTVEAMEFIAELSVTMPRPAIVML